MALTGIDLLVATHAVGVHDALEAGREAVGADERGGHVPAGDAVNHGTHPCLALGHRVDTHRDETEGGDLQGPFDTPSQTRLERRGSLGGRLGDSGPLLPSVREDDQPHCPNRGRSGESLR